MDRTIEGTHAVRIYVEDTTIVLESGVEKVGEEIISLRISQIDTIIHLLQEAKEEALQNEASSTPK